MTPTLTFRPRLIALAVLAVSGLCSTGTFAAAPDINGGTSWNGWTSEGLSNQVGVFGPGLTTAVYEVYSTVFSFNNNSVSGSPTGGGSTGGATGFGTGSFSTGAFTNGDTILGVGVRVVSGGSTTGLSPTARFDLDADSYQAATSVGGSDGRTSSGTYSEYKDFTVQFNGSNWAGSTLNAQAGAGSFYGGPSNFKTIASGYGSGTSEVWAFRAFAQTAGAGSYQMFFDLTAMQALYGPNAFGVSGFPGIGSFGNPVRVSLNGLGSNSVVIETPTVPVPEPETYAMLLAGLGVLGAVARRRQVKQT